MCFKCCTCTYPRYCKISRLCSSNSQVLRKGLFPALFCCRMSNCLLM
uniref:Uncharacterized protein n=1 Tax=Arundo donax TaxID=35708 RepID=A0A0A9D778_ARUDO